MVGVAHGPGSAPWVQGRGGKGEGAAGRARGEPQYRRLDLMLDTVYAELMEQARGSALDGWQFVREKHGVKVSRRAAGGGGGGAGLKGVGLIHARPEEVFEVLWDVEKRSRWDRMVESSRLVRRLNDQCALVYITLAGKLAVSPRDLCVLYAHRRLASGAFVVVIRSIVHDEVPVVSGFVRAELHTSGFLVEPHYGIDGVATSGDTEAATAAKLSMSASGGGGGQGGGRRHRRAVSDVAPARGATQCTASLVTYVVQLDFKGWLPGMISSMLTMYQPLRISTLRECVECNIRVKKRIGEEQSCEASDSSANSATHSSPSVTLRGFVGWHEFERTHGNSPSPNNQRDNVSLFLNRTSTPALLHALPSNRRLFLSDGDDGDDDSPRVALRSPTSSLYSSESNSDSDSEQETQFLDAREGDSDDCRAENFPCDSDNDDDDDDDDDDEVFLESTSDMTVLFDSPLQSEPLQRSPTRKSLRSASVLLSPGGRHYGSTGAKLSGGGAKGRERERETEVEKRNEELRACLFVLQHELEQTAEREQIVAAKVERLRRQLEQEESRRRVWETEQSETKATAERRVQELLTKYLTRVGAIGEEQKRVDADFSRSHSALMERLALLTHFHEALAGRHASQARYRVYWGCLVFVVFSALATAWVYRATGPVAALLPRAFAAAAAVLRRPRALVALAARRVASLTAFASSIDERLND